MYLFSLQILLGHIIFAFSEFKNICIEEISSDTFLISIESPNIVATEDKCDAVAEENNLSLMRTKTERQVAAVDNSVNEIDENEDTIEEMSASPMWNQIPKTEMRHCGIFFRGIADNVSLFIIVSETTANAITAFTFLALVVIITTT